MCTPDGAARSRSRPLALAVSSCWDLSGDSEGSDSAELRHLDGSIEEAVARLVRDMIEIL
jgi:hypothetical protein